MKPTGSITEKALRKQSPTAILGCFFSIFLIVGAIAFFFIFIRPAHRVLSAGTWNEAPCVILASSVEAHHGDDSTTYSVAVRYEYSVEDGKYTSDRYSFAIGSSSGYEGKRSVVERLPPGLRTVCYVNPDDPADAVLEREMTAEMLFGLFPLIFVAVGGGGVLFIVSSRRKKSQTAATGGTGMRREPKPAAPPAASWGPVTIKPAVSPIGKLLIAIAIALFWNGIVSVFVYQAVAGTGIGAMDWFLRIFLIPFVVVGAGLIGWVVYQLLGLFNPRPLLRLGSASVVLGEAVDIEWETAGNLGRIRTFRITLEGREEASYRQGTSTKTDRQTFATRVVAEGPTGEHLRRGRARIDIPADTMHSWKSTNNRIVWIFRIHGECPNWPDLDEEFAIEVLPRRVETRMTA